MRQESGNWSGGEADSEYMDGEVVREHKRLHEPVKGLAIAGDGAGSVAEAMSSSTESLDLKCSGPTVSPEMLSGTILTKVTKRKRKPLTFVLDIESAKVSWNPTNSSKRIYIDDIKQIRSGSDARNYREECGASVACEARWFTIIYADSDRSKGRPQKAMHLIAPTKEVFDLWTMTLAGLATYRHELMAGLAGSGQDEKTLRGHWEREMTKLFNNVPRAEHEQHLDFQGVEILCRSLHIHCPKNAVRDHFDQADKNRLGYLNFQEFQDFVCRLKHRSEIEGIFKSFTQGSDELDFPHFLEFLGHAQNVEVDANILHWEKAFAKCARKANCNEQSQLDASDGKPLRMSLAGFSAFLTSKFNRVYSKQMPATRLERPLNEYFISSSHNTYLLGRQVAGSSSTEAYIRALQRACRCVEIDCWDGPDGRPIVMHGRTLTSSVLFADCISVINKYAFAASEYPLILSLEVHCNPEQQQVMVDIMVNQLGDQLIRDSLMTNAVNLPSPEDLKRRILVKVKAGKEPVSNKELPFQRRDRSFSSPFSRPIALDNSIISDLPSLSSPPSTSPPDHSNLWLGGGRGSTTTTSMSSATDDSDTTQPFNPPLRSPGRQRSSSHKSKIIPSLGILGVYTQGIKFMSFTSSDSKQYNHVYSVAERTFDTMCRDQDTKALLEKHNMHHLMRVYPSGYRINSNNPDPLAFWRRGVQMAALNWQTYDLGMQMNEAMFANGSDRTGYVLKPRELRTSTTLEEEILEPTILGIGKIHKKVMRFSVDMISAQQLPRPRKAGIEDTVDPYIEIEMFSAEDKGKEVASGEGGQDASARNGMSGIGSPHRRRTQVIRNNGYNPIFNEKFKLQVETKYPSLVFVRWTVWDSQDGRNYNNNTSLDPLATFTAKLSSLREGYRHLPLYDHNGDQFLFATLFCKIEKEEAFTVEREDPIAEKHGSRSLRQLGQTIFKRTASMDKKKTAKEPSVARDLSTKSTESRSTREEQRP